MKCRTPRSLNSHSAGGRSSENRLLNFDILMLLGDNYGVTIYKIAEELQPHLLAIKYRLRSVEILDRVFFQMAFTDKQAIVTPLNKDHCATSH